MASTNKTPQGFNLWVESDKPKMEDFNTDNMLVDATLAQKANATDMLQALNKKADLTEVYTRQEVYNKAESDERFIAHSELPNLDVVAINEALATKANKADLEAVANSAANNFEDIHTKLEGKADIGSRPKIPISDILNSGFTTGGVDTNYYRKDQFGNVQLYGYVVPTSGTLSSGSFFFTLPVGFRPLERSVYIPGHPSISGTPKAVQNILIYPDGRVRYYTDIATTDHVAFNGSFPTE